MKICNKCRLGKDTSDFYKKISSASGFSSFCKECSNNQIKKKRLANSEQYKETARRSYKKNREKRVASQKTYNINNPEIRKKCRRNWVVKNPEASKRYNHERRVRKLNSEGKFCKKDLDFIFTSQKGRCISCPKSLKKGYDIDHIIPLSKGGGNDKYNIQLLCSACNKSKHAKDPIVFMQQKGFLL